MNNGNKCFVNGEKSTDASIFGFNSHQTLQLSKRTSKCEHCETWFMFYPLDSWNTKKLKKTTNKMLIFYEQQSYFSQIVSKKAKTTILFFMKNSKNNNIIFGFSF